MKNIFKFLLNPWTLRILGFISLSVVIWFLGPLIAIADYEPLESSRNRYIFIAVIISFYLGKLIWNSIKAKKINLLLIEGLLTKNFSKSDASTNENQQSNDALHSRFKELTSILKKTKLKRSGFSTLMAHIGNQYVYELPWYVFVGAPGSGKTTALVNSGLQFPFADRLGSKEIRGIGGTRNCDWFITDQAVLIDTAGRFITQESHQEVDSAEWLGFLRLLKKYRPRRPINGIIVTVSVSDLLQLNAPQLEEQANKIRKRIQELHTEFGIRFPIYVLVTKIDLLAGFIEFFDEFGKEQRSQVWGTTFELPEKPDNNAVAPNFLNKFSELEHRLNDRLIDYLQKERNLQKRSRLYIFPQQFSVLTKILDRFLNQVFTTSQFEYPPLLRGVYFTSGIQEGNPIDRVMAISANALRLDRKLIFPTQTSGKSFFLTKLINEVIFTESELAGTNLRWERQQGLIQWGTFGIAILATAAIGSIWSISYSRNKAYVQDVEKNIPTITKQVEQLPITHNTDLLALLSVLRSVAEIGMVPGIDRDSPPLSMGFGLFQGEKLADAANSSYQKLLNEAFLPYLAQRIEYLLNHAINSNNLELLYETLKAYLMLYQAEHFDSIALKAFILTDWELSLPQDFSKEQRNKLISHLDTLLNQGKLASPIEADLQLIKKAREIINKIPIEERIYHRLKRLDIGSEIPAFSIMNSVGSNASLIFERASGLSLMEGIPGLYTYNGYYQSFLANAKETTKQLAKEALWVLELSEKQYGLLTKAENEVVINDKVQRLYLNDYLKIWDSFIKDIRIKRTKTLRESIDLARLISSPDSVIPILLHAIAKEVTLASTEENEKNLIDKATDEVKNASKKIKELLGKTDIKNTLLNSYTSPEFIVDKHFEPLRRLVRSNTSGQPTQIDAMLSQIKELYFHLSAAEEAFKENIPPSANKINSSIETESENLPEPFRSIFRTFSKDSASQIQKGTQGVINKPLAGSITQFCRKTTSGRYPFDRSSSQDITQADFSELFSVGGRFDDFFQKFLAQHVDTSTKPWRFRKSSEPDQNISSKDLQEFYRANNIRNVFFKEGGKTPNVNLSFKPIDMDPSISQFILDIDGQIVKYSHGPQIPVSIQWPGPRGSSQVRLQISPITPNGKSGGVFNGPWALFRMFDTIQITPIQDDIFMAIFDINGRKVKFEISTHSILNPFRLNDLTQFRCPEKL